MHLGIDASNLRQGGGITHLRELLSAAEPVRFGMNVVTVWGCKATLNALPDHPWLIKVPLAALEGRTLRRGLWQQLELPRLVEAAGCDVLFAPGGTIPRRCRTPVVTMSQNMLPFEPEQARLFGALHPMRLKMALLRRHQASAFRRADGVIFLSNYARDHLVAALGLDRQRSALIPHGIDPRFYAAPRHPATAAGPAEPFRFLYVSILMPYKHQIEVAYAVARLCDRGIQVTMDFVGPPWGNYADKLTKVVRQLDPSGSFLRVEGAMPFEQLHERYAQADGFVFASSCENLPNILIEAMASGLPIACAQRGPMPEVLGDGGIYFEPESPESIANALKTLVEDRGLQARLAERARARALAYSWKACAEDTFAFLSRFAR